MLKFRLILIFIGAFVLLRFLGRLLRAKRAAHQQEQEKKREMALKKRKEFVRKNEGKVFIIPSETKMDNSDIEDAKYEDA